MADGTTKPISEVQVGDQVLSRNPDTGQDEAKTVTSTIERHASAVVDIALHDAKTGKTETLTCTPEHPLYVQAGLGGSGQPGDWDQHRQPGRACPERHQRD